MQWWLILLIGLGFGVLVVAVAGLAVRSRMTDLQMALTTLDEHKLAGERLGQRAEKLQADIERLQARIPQQGK
ncbi:hypothetical protein [Stackebrandtia nassauensis]|uniref:Uncharacterized protein n=1 Tax=Stackebrandtia nassauensis (strain DSM 44728 / CIP 108903 / NRRL B-16338 / NBRC 102104 / LLR-40K-21) TaxID=446470 RepID=D3Q550_STANL|nr:hypothetical protein [Stackebrandtia nassauensis]ADD44099.1 hypothetical protein Snas_4454 [Stackebrandtia nassauensis DSM 44728]